MSAADRSNAWHLLDVADRATDTPVSVVIPARDAQTNLDRLLASLQAQRYPSELVEIVVVDDGSDVPLTVPTGITLLRQESDGRFGAGRARNLGAAHASGDVIVFLDSDMLVGGDFLGRLLRWYEASPAAVVTGIVRFFDVGAVGSATLEQAIAGDGLEALLGPVSSEDQSWREKTFARTFDLTVDRSDLFRITIGALMCVPRDLHERIGGLRELGMRGIEDTEYGYRLHNAGALLVLDRSLAVWHQGRRFFDSTAAKRAKAQRAELIEELIPEPSFRADTSRDRRVPVAVIETDDAAVVVGLDDSLRRDIAVVSEPPSDGDRLRDLEAAPFTMRVHRSCRLRSDTLDLVIERCSEVGLGILTLVDPDGQEIVTVSRRRAVGRARMDGGDMARTFPDWALPCGEFGVAPTDS